jgi:prepilin-type N-terminal cleavage/methylation domain-containing protein
MNATHRLVFLDRRSRRKEAPTKTEEELMSLLTSASTGRGLCTRAFTLIEMLVVIAIMALLATLIVGLAGLAGRKARETAVRGQMHEYITAIEEYKGKFGFYPPDNGFNKTRGPNQAPNSVSNQLFYELTGVLVTNNAFRALTGNSNVNLGTITSFFGAAGFVNSALDASEVKNFLPSLKQSQHREIIPGSGAEVLVVSADAPQVPGPPVPANPKLNPWHYVSSGPTNNPNSFDLWAELWIGGKLRVIANGRE